MNIDKLIADTSSLYVYSGAIDDFGRTLVNPVTGKVRTGSDPDSLVASLNRLTDNVVLTLTQEGSGALASFHGPRLEIGATHEEIYRSASAISHFCNLAHQGASFLVSQKASHASLSAVQNKLNDVPENVSIEQLEALMKGEAVDLADDGESPETVGQYL